VVRERERAPGEARRDPRAGASGVEELRVEVRDVVAHPIGQQHALEELQERP